MPPPKRRVRVAVVTDAIAPYHRGGKETRYVHLLPRLAARCDVRVYTMHWWPERANTKILDGVEYRSVCPLIMLYKGSRRSILEATVFAVACLRLLSFDFDVLEADHMPYLQLFTLWLVCKLKRRPLVVTWNEVWGPSYWVDYLGPRAGRVAWWIERTTMSLPDEILAISAGTAERLRSYLGDSTPVREVNMGVDLDQIDNVRPASSEESAELLFVGRLLAHKGVDLLIDALRLLQTRPAVHLLIVGDGPERERLANRVAELGMTDVVCFRPRVATQEELFALMKAARVFVFPSLREGFGIAPLEALACGTWVVTVSSPDNHARHLVARSDRGLVVEPTPAALAAGIDQALDDSADKRVSREAWLRAFDWSSVAEAYYDALVHARPRFSSSRNGRLPERVVSRC